MLSRLGANAHLTLGRRKAVDIVVEKDNKLVTIDVKGLAGRTNWPMDNISKIDQNHFFVLVSFLDKIKNPSIAPEVYVVPSIKVRKLLYINPKGNRQVIKLSDMRKKATRYKDKWELITK